MTSRTAKRLVLPAVLVVSTFVSATSCNDPSKEEHCADIEKQSVCESAEGCGWDMEHGWCHSTCDLYETQAECDAIDRCQWFSYNGGSETGGSETGGTETGGDGSCEPPFS
jgi:hypothetical protein